MKRRVEVGGEFSIDDQLQGKDTALPHQLFFSEFEGVRYTMLGRMALELILRDIMSERRVGKVLLPNYLCASMISPVEKSKLLIDYYSVEVSGKEIKFTQPNIRSGDVFIGMSYFGYKSATDNNLLYAMKELGAITVEDVTHRMLSCQPVSPYADYAYSSLRKWVAIPSGGMALKRRGSFLEACSRPAHKNLINKKLTAMMNKARYLNGNKVDKSLYLHQFRSFEREINELEDIYELDSYSRYSLSRLEWHQVINRRQENASFIHKELSKSVYRLKGIEALFEFRPGDTPIFVPIRTDSKIINEVQKKMVKRGLYVPIHWPKPDNMKIFGKGSSLFEQTISLVIDQRYCISDMKLYGEILSTLD